MNYKYSLGIIVLAATIGCSEQPSVRTHPSDTITPREDNATEQSDLQEKLSQLLSADRYDESRTQIVENWPEGEDDNVARAKQFFDIGNYEQAVREFTALIERNPNISQFYSARGDAWIALGEHEKAIDDFKLAFIQDGRLLPRFTRGEHFQSQGRFHRAIACYHLAFEEGIVFNRRGRAYHALGLNEKALADFSRAIEMESSVVEYYIDRGKLLQELGRSDAALDDYSKVIELQPSYYLGYKLRGQLHQELGNTSAARSDLRKEGELITDSSKDEFALNILQRHGVRVEFNDMIGGRIAIFTSPASATDENLALLDDLEGLIGLHLNNTEMTDGPMRHVRKLSELTHLSLYNTRVTDAGLAHIEDLRNLSRLSLSWTGITDSGLQYLRELTELRVLSLSSTEISDQGVMDLLWLTKLEALQIDGTDITANGVDRLSNYPKTAL